MTVSPPRQAYDLILYPPSGGTIGLMLTRQIHEGRNRGALALGKLLSRYAPSNGDEQVVIRDAPIVQDDFSGGFGYSQRWVIPNTYAYGENVCTRWPRVVVPAGELTLAASLGTIGRINCAMEYNGNLYWGTTGGRILSSAGGSGNPTVAATVAATQIYSAARFNGNLYFGTNANLVRINSVGSVSELAGITRQWIATVYNVTADNVGANRLWGADGFNTTNIRYTSGDPSVAGNWSSSIQVGDSTHYITGLTASNRHVWTLKIDGIHDLDELGYSPNLTPYWRATLDTSVFQVALVHEGYLYASQGRRGLERLNLARGAERRDAPDWCQPGFGIPNETPIQGYPTAIVSDQGWICLAIANPVNGKAYVMYGKERTALGVDGPGPILWHGAEAVIIPAAGNTTVEITNLHVATPASGGQPVLWISAFEQTSQNVKVYKLSLPKASSPLSDVFFGGAHRFTTAGSLYFTAQDWSQEYGMATKQVNIYDVRADSLGSGNSIALYSSADAGAYVLEGTASASGRSRLGPTTRSGYTIALRADLVSTVTSPAILRGVRMLAGVLAELDEYTPYEVELDSADRKGVLAQKAALIALQSAAPFIAVNPFGERVTVRMGQGIEFDAEEAAENRRWRMKARILLRVMDFSA